MLFLDSSIPEEVEEICAWGVTSGITTNPLILVRESSGVDLETRIKQILAVSTGPVSVELTTESFAEMLSEALRYSGWDPQRVCIKVPCTVTGLKVVHRLAAQGVPTNMTCMMNFNQLYLSALAGATYVSLFSGRVRDLGQNVRPVIRETRAILDREPLPSRIIVGSIRHLMDVTEALQAGAHIVTVPPAILRKMLHHPRTDSTIREFNDAWNNRS